MLKTRKVVHHPGGTVVHSDIKIFRLLERKKKFSASSPVTMCSPGESRLVVYTYSTPTYAYQRTGHQSSWESTSTHIAIIPSSWAKRLNTPSCSDPRVNAEHPSYIRTGRFWEHDTVHAAVMVAPDGFQRLYTSLNTHARCMD